MPKPAGEPSTPEQALTTDAHGRSRPEQGITSGAADGPQPDSALTAQRSAEPPREGEQPKPASANAAGAPGEASQHSASALAGAAAAAAATLATEDRDALITSQPSVGTVETRSGSKGTTEGLTGAEEPEAAAAKAPYDPLGMDAPDEAPDPAEVRPALMTDVKQPGSLHIPRLLTSGPLWPWSCGTGLPPLKGWHLPGMHAAGLKKCAMHARLCLMRLAQKRKRMWPCRGTTQSGTCSSTSPLPCAWLRNAGELRASKLL